MEFLLRFVAALGLVALALLLLSIIFAIIQTFFKQRKRDRMIQDIDAMFKEILEEKNNK